MSFIRLFQEKFVTYIWIIFMLPSYDPNVSEDLVIQIKETMLSDQSVATGLLTLPTTTDSAVC